MIDISEKALAEVRRIMKEKNVPADYFLRLLVEGGGGCGGAKYRLGFDKQKEGDDFFMAEDVKVIFEKKTLLFLLSVKLDYEERENEQGFIFKPKLFKKA